jgi:hypothetical protein
LRDAFKETAMKTKQALVRIPLRQTEVECFAVRIRYGMSASIVSRSRPRDESWFDELTARAPTPAPQLRRSFLAATTSCPTASALKDSAGLKGRRLPRDPALATI